MTQQDILKSLGITDSTQQQNIINGVSKLLILDASAHLDWDWVLPFHILATCENFQERAGCYFKSEMGPANAIFSKAATYLNDSNYHYSICETAFLRAFALTQAESKVNNFAVLKQNAINNKNLRIAGGGITSPDSLLSHGETFIRNYLIGHAWLSANCPFVPVPRTAWLPDDFGHDPQLPVVLQAMGFTAAGFARVPGNAKQCPANPLQNTPSLQQVMTDNDGKIDFNWTTVDGSSILAHFLPGWYNQGIFITGNDSINGYITTNEPNSPTPYIYVPVLDDFALPKCDLANLVTNWNNSPIDKTVIAACGSFEDYAQLVQFHPHVLEAPYGDQFNANPYYTGCYGARPALKILHQRSSRNLLAAEVFGIFAAQASSGGATGYLGTGVSIGQQLEEAWNLLVPSTHHDYISGTAIPDVFHTEQLTLLKQADTRAAWLLNDAMETIAGAIAPDADKVDTSVPVAIFNRLGFPVSGLVELTAQQFADTSMYPGAQSSREQIILNGPPFQTTSNGGLLFSACAPSLGYQTAYLNNAWPAPQNSVTITEGPQQIVICNNLVKATLSTVKNGIWQLSSVEDVLGGRQLLQEATVANELLFYEDGGDEYRFGMEFSGSVWKEDTGNPSNPSKEILESGPLRVVIRTSATYTINGKAMTYLQEYIIHANEPMLRMRTIGTAPLWNDSTGCSVLVAFPLATQGNNIETLVRGTPYHWTDATQSFANDQSLIYWNEQTFLPAHNFVIPKRGDGALCAFYHTDIPCWGLSNKLENDTSKLITNNGSVYACLLRNGVGTYFENRSPDVTYPAGTDNGIYTREYALRVPYGLLPAETCAPLKEALAYASKLEGLLVSNWTGSMPDNDSIAAATENNAIITVAKPGTVNENDLVLRIYQPTNKALPVTISIASFLNGAAGNIVVNGKTALEQDLDKIAHAALNLQSTSDSITFNANTITTLAVTPIKADAEIL